MSHAFPAAIAAGDANALIDTLAPDVVLYSAVTATPFVGREVVADTYRSVLESFEELRIVDEFESGDTHAFFWEGRMEGRAVTGADRIRLNPDGKVREITVLGRPMSGVATFLTGIGPRLARRRRGGAVATLLRVTRASAAPAARAAGPRESLDPAPALSVRRRQKSLHRCGRLKMRSTLDFREEAPGCPSCRRRGGCSRCDRPRGRADRSGAVAHGRARCARLPPPPATRGLHGRSSSSCSTSCRSPR